MSWFRLTFALVALFAIGGCGWQPLYGRLGQGDSATGGDAAPALASVHIAPIADRTGQNLYNALRDRMNPAGAPGEPRYDLVVSITEQTNQMLIQQDQTASRIDLTIYAHYALYQRGNSKPVLLGQSRAVTTYDLLSDSDEFATIQSANDAHRRGANSLADDIANRLAVFLAQPSGG